MDLTFDYGNPQEPRGHALAYFHHLSAPEQLFATYIVVLPIPIDIVKYVPPFLAAQAGGLTQGELSAFAFPPVPEPVEGYSHLLALAQARQDDLLACGGFNPEDVTGTLGRVNDVVQAYAQACGDYLARVRERAPISQEPEGLGVDEVLYSLMGERDKLEELSRLIGKLRFALEGKDHRMVREAEEEVKVLARYLPQRYPVARLLEVARDPSLRGARLAQLYLEWCFSVAGGEEEQARQLEARIREMERESGLDAPGT